MDCMMPKLDGYKASERIREDDTNPNQKTPIIALTANAMEGDKEKCLEAGMSDYIEKPLRPAQLNEMLNRWSAKVPANQVVNGSQRPINEDSKIIDFETMYETFDNDYDLVKDPFDTFKEDLQESVPNILNAIEDGNYEEASRHAHSLKGSSASYGASRLNTFASEAEQAFNKGDIESARRLTQGAFKESKRVIAAIESHQWPIAKD